MVPQLTLPDVQSQIDTYIDSGRYAADLAVVADSARAWLEEGAPARSSRRSSSTSTRPRSRTGRRTGSNGWARILDGGCDLEQRPVRHSRLAGDGALDGAPPTVALVQRARELGVAVFFITGRPPELREATERNLREQGYAWDGVILLPPGAHFDSAADFKAPERSRIAEHGYTILLTMGDQQSDLDGGYAEKTFKLPNPVYTLP